MPIEVRELVIKATVVNGSSGGSTAATGSDNNAVTANEEIINVCVERILEIIKDKKER